MSKIVGRLSRLAISTDGGTTYTEINGIIDATLNLSQAEIGSTSHDSGDFEEFLIGRKDGTIDFGLRFDEADPGQDKLQDSLFAGTLADYRFRMEVASGKDEYKARGLVTSITPSGPNDDAAGMDASVRLTGTITKTAQP